MNLHDGSSCTFYGRLWASSKFLVPADVPRPGSSNAPPPAAAAALPAEVSTAASGTGVTSREATQPVPPAAAAAEAAQVAGKPNSGKEVAG
jgi:hypothetical protein